MRAKSWLFAVMVIVSAASPVRAEWFVTPFFGGNFGGASREPLFPGGVTSSMPVTLGVTGGWTSSKGIGVEADLGRAPKFYDSDRGFVTDRSVLTLMGNARYTVPVHMGKHVEPFVSGGAGLIRPNIA